MSAIARTAATAVARSLLSLRSPRRRSSSRTLSANSSPISSQRLSAKSVLSRSSARLAAFSSGARVGRLSKPGVRGVELGDRGVEVVDVEQHL